MGLGGCYAVLKYFLLFFNLVFALVGIAGVSLCIWLLVDPSFTPSLNQSYVISVIIILAASLLLIVVAVFGIIGALQEGQCALITFFCLLLIVFVAKISAGVYIYINRDNLKMEIKTVLEIAVENDYYQNTNQKLFVDTFQQQLECCGANGPSDWMEKQKTVDVSVRSSLKNYSIPSSCCRKMIPEDRCKAKIQNIRIASSIDEAIIYKNGCYEAIMNKLEEFLCPFLITGTVIVLVEVLALIFALILAFAVNRSRRYKA